MLAHSLLDSRCSSILSFFPRSSVDGEYSPFFEDSKWRLWSYDPLFASLSAFSIPLVPACPGTQEYHCYGHQAFIGFWSNPRLVLTWVLLNLKLSRLPRHRCKLRISLSRTQALDFLVHIPLELLFPTRTLWGWTTIRSEIVWPNSYPKQSATCSTFICEPLVNHSSSG